MLTAYCVDGDEGDVDPSEFPRVALVTVDDPPAKKPYHNPTLVVDALVWCFRSSRPGYCGPSGYDVLLIKRKKPLPGETHLRWALPGGYVDYGETLKAAAERELREETGLVIFSLRFLRMYDDPGRDPRNHNVSAVFSGCYGTSNTSKLKVGDDAAEAAWWKLEDIVGAADTQWLAFDHFDIIRDWARSGKFI